MVPSCNPRPSLPPSGSHNEGRTSGLGSCRSGCLSDCLISKSDGPELEVFLFPGVVSWVISSFGPHLGAPLGIMLKVDVVHLMFPGVVSVDECCIIKSR